MERNIFSDYFFSVVNWISKEYPTEKIFYSPHGRSIEDSSIRLVCEDFKIETIASKYTIELDYSWKRYNPVAIIGFGSTALVTLKKVYPQANVINIFLPSKVELFAKKNTFINEYLEKEGILTKRILE